MKAFFINIYLIVLTFAKGTILVLRCHGLCCQYSQAHTLTLSVRVSVIPFFKLSVSNAVMSSVSKHICETAVQ